MIDRLRQELQERLEQVLSEADKLRRALAALDPRGGGSGRDGANGSTRSRTPDRSATATPSRARRGSSRATGQSSAGRGAAAGASATPKRPRTAPGATRRQILDALSGGQPMTAGEVAAATGLQRGTVSTTLSKLVHTGEVTKATRGYQLPQPDPTGS